MKERIISICFVFSISLSHTGYAEMQCPEIDYNSDYTGSYPTIDAAEIIQIDGPLFAGGRVKCDISLDYKTLKNNERKRIEEGTYKGIKYRIYYSDGSGAIQGQSTNILDYIKDKRGTNWATHCEADEMDDTHWCSLNKKDLRVSIWKDGTPFVSVGYSYYPGSKIAVRIDKNKPITANEKRGFTKAQSLKIIKQLKKGDSV